MEKWYVSNIEDVWFFQRNSQFCSPFNNSLPCVMKLQSRFVSNCCLPPLTERPSRNQVKPCTNVEVYWVDKRFSFMTIQSFTQRVWQYVVLHYRGSTQLFLTSLIAWNWSRPWGVEWYRNIVVDLQQWQLIHYVQCFNESPKNFLESLIYAHFNNSVCNFS